MNYLCLFFLLAFPVSLQAEIKNQILPEGAFLLFSPPVVNKNYFNLEFGFITEKEFKPWKYPYNAYVTAGLFQDTYKRNDNLKSAGLGFRGGVLLPTQPWIPLMGTLALGYSKTVLHKNPIFGRDESSRAKKNMLAFEAGLLYHFDHKYVLRYHYQISNVRFLKTHFMLSLGVDY